MLHHPGLIIVYLKKNTFYIPHSSHQNQELTLVLYSYLMVFIAKRVSSKNELIQQPCLFGFLQSGSVPQSFLVPDLDSSQGYRPSILSDAPLFGLIYVSCEDTYYRGDAMLLSPHPVRWRMMLICPSTDDVHFDPQIKVSSSLFHCTVPLFPF